MNIFMSKEIRLNIRIKPDLKNDLQSVADFYGLTVTSYVHSILVRKIREEKEREPEAFSAKLSGDSKVSATGTVKKGSPVFDVDMKDEAKEKKKVA